MKYGGASQDSLGHPHPDVSDYDAHEARGAWGRLTGRTGARPATPRHGHGTGQQPLGWRQLRAWGERFTARGPFAHADSTPQGGGVHYVQVRVPDVR